MNIREALQALAEGRKIQRPGSWVLELQDATVPLLTNHNPPNYGVWLFCKFPLIADHPTNHQHAAEVEMGAIGAPYAFVPEDMNSEDWSIIE